MVLAGVLLFSFINSKHILAFDMSIDMGKKSLRIFNFQWLLQLSMKSCTIVDNRVCDKILPSGKKKLS